MAAELDGYKELVARIDERTKALTDSFNRFTKTFEEKFDEIQVDLEKNYTQKVDFDPIKKLVYGFVGFILLSVGGMFVTVLVKANSLPAEVTTFHSPSIVRPLLSSPSPSLPEIEK